MKKTCSQTTFLVESFSKVYVGILENTKKWNEYFRNLFLSWRSKYIEVDKAEKIVGVLAAIFFFV